MPRVAAARIVAARPLRRRAAGIALLLLVVGWLWWMLDPSAAALRADGARTTWHADHWIGLGLAALLAGLLGRYLVRLQGEAAAGRDACARLQALGDVLDVWQWHTDVRHRLVQACPPSGAPGTDRPVPKPGQSLWEHFRAVDEPALRAQMLTCAALDDVAVWRQTDGGPVPARLRGRPTHDASGSFAGYVGILRDGTGAASPDAAPVQVAGAAPRDEAQREAFHYTVSHDLRAPIRVVEGFTKIVKEDYAGILDQVGIDHLDRVLGAAGRMTSMIDALLALSKLSSRALDMQPVNLSQLAGFVADDLRRLQPERQVAFHIADGLVVLGDPTLLRVLLENLLGNAWKYTSARTLAEIHFVCSRAQPPTFTVSDNGAGFDMRFVDRLFGVFQRLHSPSEFPGTGIGLASVQRIVHRHGGTIWAESEVDHGTRLHFTLPTAPRRA